MRFHWIFRSFLGCLLVTLLACEDPSNVGLGLVDEQGGEPFVVDVPSSTFTGEDARDLTGSNNTPRFLAGSVFDPLLGTTTATGYVDFFGDPSDDFKASTVESVTLQLARDYVYGDTTDTVTLTLRVMNEDWSSQDVPADTTLEAGEVVMEFSFTAADTLIEVPLPEAWVTANERTFRSDDFLTAFNGFQLAATSGNAVVGFTRSNSLLRAITASEDTTTYAATKNLSTYVQASDGAGLPPGVQLLRDGVGPSARLMFDFTQGDLRFESLNRAVIRLQEADEILAANTPAHFHRPILPTFNLVGVDELDETSAVLVPSATRGDDGVLSFESPDLRIIIQRLLFDETPITHFRIEVPPADNSISVLLVREQPADAGPSARLTLTPSAN